MVASLKEDLGPENEFQVDKAYALNDEEPESYIRLTLMNGRYPVDVVAENEEVLGSFHVFLDKDRISTCHSHGFIYSSVLDGLDSRSHCLKRDINGKEVFDRRCFDKVAARGDVLASRQPRCGQFSEEVEYGDQDSATPRCTYTGGNCDYQRSCSG